MLELLAPAGSMEALRAAVQNGANAVYLGCGTFNARQGAKNFTPQALTEAIKYCHVRGVAVHLTLNTLVSDKEIPQACELIRHAAESGVDAFIVQDLGIVRLCREIAPNVDVHGSTQLTVHSIAGVQFCAAMGMSRVVLSRELSAMEIRAICEESPIEIEVFAHGALCMCYSGQCYLSSAIGGRSGNRGRCAQPCRQAYGFGRWENRYPLSLKDNCLAPYLQELEAMGVASVKLEGRMKRAEYVAAVTAVYRKAIDEMRFTKEMHATLMTAFNRQGFTDGYYMGKTGPAMFGVRTDTRENEQWLAAVRQTYETAENPLVDITFRATVTLDGCAVTVTDPDGHTCTAYGPKAQVARNLPLTEEALTDRLAKTGGTPFRCVGVEALIDPGLTVSAAAVNGMRRDALNQLTALRARRDSIKLNRPPKITHYSPRDSRFGLTVQVTSREQITENLLRQNLLLLYVPVNVLSADRDWAKRLAGRVTVAAVLPRIVRDTELVRLKSEIALLKELGIRDVLIGNVGLLIPMLDLGMQIHGDFGLNLYNSASLNIARELKLRSAALSFEMTMPQIRDVSKAVPCELLVYGRMQLMVTENCIIRNRTGECTCRQGPQKLVDKTGAEFPIIKDCGTCRSVLLNSRKLYWLDRQDDLEKLGIWAMRLYFTTENPREVDNVLSACRNPQPFDPGACTRGLYLRGLE